MKFFLVLVITLGSGKPPDALLSNTFDASAQCEAARMGVPALAQRLVGTRKTDGTEVLAVKGVCVEGTAAESRATIQARALRK